MLFTKHIIPSDRRILFTGADRGYLKCGIQGTNNQLQNRFYKFAHLQLFNFKYKFALLELLEVKGLFFKKIIFYKQKRTVVYGRAFLVSDFKLTQENDDLLSLKHK